MRTSAAGIDLIKRNEGCELHAYQDVVGVWTIGYGDTLNVHSGMRITQQEAEEGLARRLANEFEPGVMAAIGNAPTTQAQFDAMVSLAWNIGVGGFARSSVARLHKAGDYMAAASAFALWDKAGGRVIEGLVRRRREEADLYLSGVVPQPTSQPASSINPDYLLVLQGFLAASGDYTGDIDGLDGPLTRAAVAAVQRRQSA